jgi:hypothetical protein
MCFFSLSRYILVVYTLLLIFEMKKEPVDGRCVDDECPRGNGKIRLNANRNRKKYNNVRKCGEYGFEEEVVGWDRGSVTCRFRFGFYG